MKKITSYCFAALLLAPQLAFAQDGETVSEETTETTSEMTETTPEMSEGEVVESTETMEESSSSSSGGFNEALLGWAVEGAVSLPTGDLNFGLGFGAFFKGEYAFQRQLHFTGRAGILLHPFKDATLIQVPVLVGARYFVQPQIFVNGEIGLNWMRVSANGWSDSNLRVPVGLGGGYVINKQLEARGELFFSDFFDGFQLLGAVAYRFNGL